MAKKTVPVDQPSAAPTTKVSAGVIAGALSVLVVYLIDQIGGVIVPPEVASAITTVISFLAAYFTPNRAEVVGR